MRTFLTPATTWREAAEFAPALALATLVTAALCGAQLVPTGPSMLLVRLPTPPGTSDAGAAALDAAIRADAALVSIPAPGFAVIHGDAAQARRALGLVVAWNDATLCAPAAEIAR